MPNDIASSHASRFHSGMLALIARGDSQIAENHLTHKNKHMGGVDPTNSQAMIFYSPKDHVDLDTLKPLGSPDSLGGKILSGTPKLVGRIDFMSGPQTGGLFMCTTCKVEIHFPFTEHATILEGEVTLTDQSGQTRTLKPGDSYFVRQGQVVIWEVTGKYLLKSFFNIVSP